MKAATVELADDGTPTAPQFGDIYHSHEGGAAQSTHVFLKGNQLPQRWRGAQRFVILETGFGLGLNFINTWMAWRQDPDRCKQLYFVSIEKHPLTAEDMQRVWQSFASEPEWQTLAQKLIQAWPPLIGGVHQLTFDAGQVVLTLVWSDVRTALKSLRLQADAFYLDGFAPARNPDMWAPEILKAIGRRAAPQATAATWSAASIVRNGLRTAGFQVSKTPGFGRKRDMIQAVYAPSWKLPAVTPASTPSLPHSSPIRHAAIIGAGLAGAACARALADVGIRCTVVDQAPQPAMGASGNAAGLFHGVFHRQDGLHAKLHRAAALHAARVYDALIRQGQVTGRISGLLRLISEQTPWPTLQQWLADSGLPPTYLQLLDIKQARAHAGVAVSTPSWFYPQGGWLDPRSVVRYWLDHALIEFVASSSVATIQSTKALDVGLSRWQVLDAQQQVLIEADAVVMCHAQSLAPCLPPGPWPFEHERGQISLINTFESTLPKPQIPIVGSGYALTLPNGDVLCGASGHLDDADDQLRLGDQQENVQRYAHITGIDSDAMRALMDRTCGLLQGRVGWRFRTDDRLPIIGAVPLKWNHQALRLREITRQPGLYVCSALGSRGITWAPLAGQILASHVTGTPMPLEGELVDALDPARFMVRDNRKAVGNK